VVGWQTHRESFMMRKIWTLPHPPPAVTHMQEVQTCERRAYQHQETCVWFHT
jgi:hypothetical protein